VYVRDDRPFGGTDPPAALLYASRDRTGEHPERHLAGWAGILQADAFDGYNRLYLPDRKPSPIVEALCWSHARRKFFELADIAANTRRGKKATPISPIALEAVKRIDALFDIERDINGFSVEKRLAARQERSDALGRRARSLDARRARQTLSSCRGRQGDGLYAHALGSLHPLPRRRPYLPDQQRGGASAALGSPTSSPASPTCRRRSSPISFRGTGSPNSPAKKPPNRGLRRRVTVQLANGVLKVPDRTGETIIAGDGQRVARARESRYCPKLGAGLN
jgi:hypothetical protein